MNYITVLGYPEHKDFKEYWPANVQIIGKDIIRFHAAIWPAMLLGLKLPLPRVLYVHGFINVDNKKMSKSLGNYVSPDQVIDKYGADSFRYFFLRHIPSYEDGDFSWETFEAAHDNELANELGNAVQRTVVMLQKYQNGLIGDIPPSEHDTVPYETALEACKFDRALDDVWDQVRGNCRSARIIFTGHSRQNSSNLCQRNCSAAVWDAIPQAGDRSGCLKHGAV